MPEQFISTFQGGKLVTVRVGDGARGKGWKGFGRGPASSACFSLLALWTLCTCPRDPRPAWCPWRA